MIRGKSGFVLMSEVNIEKIVRATKIAADTKRVLPPTPEELRIKAC